MKKAILLSAILLINIAAMAQNILGKSLETAENLLNKEGIKYEGYVNKEGTYSINIFKDDEKRMLIFDIADLCIADYLFFNDSEKIYDYGKKFTELGWKQIKIPTDQKEYKKWAFKYEDVSAVCWIFTEEDRETMNYKYLLLVEIQ